MIYSRIDTPPNFQSWALGGYEALLHNVGGADFGAALGQHLSNTLELHEFFCFSRKASKEAPVVLLSGGEDARRTARVDAYTKRYFRHDPINRLLESQPVKGNYIARVRSEEVMLGDYRQFCYQKAGISEKLALARLGADGWTVLSLFVRYDQDGFPAGEFDKLTCLAEQILPLLELHARLRGNGANLIPPSIPQVEAKLAQNFPMLSPREVAVCARSIIGVTSEGIALDLGIKQTSVLTYRRRAYERLNISSVQQLSSMMLQ